MTSMLLILGASLMDACNVSRATDGLVLGVREQIAIEMGGDPVDVQLFPLQDPPRPEPAQLHNYVQGGAQLGREPMLEDEVSTFHIGFKQQLRAVRRQADFYQSLSDVDLLISAGANDVLDKMEHSAEFLDVLDTDDRRDDCW